MQAKVWRLRYIFEGQPTWGWRVFRNYREACGHLAAQQRWAQPGIGVELVEVHGPDAQP